MTARAWNHNIHHHPLVVAAIPDGARRGLDAGCGEGLLAGKLRFVMPEVTGIDRDGGCIETARREHGRPGLDFRQADLLTADLEPASFDFISCVAMLHHLDTAAGLRRLRELLRPGGRIVVIGCARTSGPAGLAAELASAVTHRVLSRRRVWAESAAPVLSPRQTYRQVRRLAQAELPGSRFRLRLLWRYSLVWTKPLE